MTDRGAIVAGHVRSAPAAGPGLRLASLLLLFSALGSLVLGMVRISFSPVFIAELQRLPGLGTLPAACVDGGIASYSGLSLATGAAPSVNAACLTHIQDSAQASLGVQPLVLVAVLAILGAVGITLWDRAGIAWRAARSASAPPSCWPWMRPISPGYSPATSATGRRRSPAGRMWDSGRRRAAASGRAGPARLGWVAWARGALAPLE